MYPTRVLTTPSIPPNWASGNQNQAIANVALSSPQVKVLFAGIFCAITVDDLAVNDGVIAVRMAFKFSQTITGIFIDEYCMNQLILCNMGTNDDTANLSQLQTSSWSS